MSGPDHARFGPYRLLEELGRGGMGAVWLAVRDGSDTPCVLKRLHTRPEEAGDIPTRFRREAHLAAQLDHPGIARVLDAGAIDRQFYIAFEHVAGVGLSDIAVGLSRQRRWLPPALVVALFDGLLEALAHAHRAVDPDGRALDLVHRDLSPQNLMIGFDGRPRIIDFGIASAKVDDFRTEPGRVLGTIRYMSPEQARLESVDARSDVYAIGVVLYEMFTARRLIKKAHLRQMLADVVVLVPPRLAEVAPKLPPDLAAAVDRALAKDVQERFQTVDELRSALLQGASGWALPDAGWTSRWLRHQLPALARAHDARMARLEAELGPNALEPQRWVQTVTAARADLEDPTTVYAPAVATWNEDDAHVATAAEDAASTVAAFGVNLGEPAVATAGPSLPPGPTPDPAERFEGTASETAPVPPPARSFAVRRRWVLGALGFVAALGVLGGTAVWSSRGRRGVARESAAPRVPEPRPVVAPAPTPRPRPAAAPLPVAPAVAPSKAPPRPSEATADPRAARPSPRRPPPPTSGATDDPESSVTPTQALLRRVRAADPKDAAQLVRLHGELRALAEELGPSAQRRVMQRADRALRGGGPAALEDAVRALEAARAGR